MMDFYGNHFSKKQCESLAQRHIDKQLLAQEHELFQTKWFDYRGLHPTKATYLYAHLFKERYQRMYAKTNDVETAEFKQGFATEDFMLSSKQAITTGLWMGRQHADRLGIPYDKFIWYGMEARFEKLWTRIPNPCQMYSADLLETIQQRWELDVSEGLYHSIWEENPDTAIGRQYQHWCCKAIAVSKANKVSILANKIYLKKSIFEKIAQDYFSQQQLDDAKSFYHRYLAPS